MWVPIAVWQPCELLYTCYLLVTYLHCIEHAGGGELFSRARCGMSGRALCERDSEPRRWEMWGVAAVGRNAAAATHHRRPAHRRPVCQWVSQTRVFSPIKLPVVLSVLRRCWLGGRKRIRPVKTEWWGVGVVICLEQAAGCLRTVQLMPLLSQTPVISCLI